MILRDRKGRLWHGRLTVQTALFLRTNLDIDVMAWLADWDVAVRDLSDPAIVANCVWGLLRESLEREGIQDHQFGKLFKNHDHTSLVEALADDLRRFADVPDTLPGHKGKASQVTPEALWGIIWQSAGVLGLDPTPYTLGELICMADAKRKTDSASNAMLCYVVASSQGAKVTVSQFDGTGFLAKSKTQEDVIELDGIHELSKVLGIPVTERKVDE